MIWLVLTLMTAAVMAGLLVPAFRRGSLTDRSAHDRAVFRDQLRELDRDVARGLIGVAEAAAARNEISRRLLQAVPGAIGQSSQAPLVAILGVLMIPLVALPLYLQRGNPKLPDVPLAARLEAAIQNQDFDAMIAKVERHMAEQPDDVQGWTVLAPAYRRLERWDDAANAYANVMRLAKATPGMIVDYGEMVVSANQGMVTAEAHRAFAEALKLDPELPKARYFDAVTLKQEGKREEARAAFQALLDDTPADAPWRAAVEAELKPDQTAMIRNMVDGLEARLKTDGSDLEDWLRLIRSRTVLGDADKAKAALAAAKERFKDRPDALASLDGLAKEVGME